MNQPKKRPPLLRFLIGCIATIHTLFLALLLLCPTSLFMKKKAQKLVVSTITLSPQIKTASPPAPKKATAAAPKPTPAPVAKSPPIPKPATPAPAKPAPAVKKQPAIADKTVSAKPAPKAPVQENRAKISDALMRQLQEDIAKIEQKGDNLREKAAATTPLPRTLQIDMADDGGSDYANTLAHRLHQTLKLPEFGEVKIQLTLHQDGTVAKISVLKTESKTNEKYLQTELPKVRFPRFDKELKGKTEHVFTLTFCNE